MWSKLVKPTYDIFHWDYWFGQVDARPLGIFRILFALILLKDAIYHLWIGELFYSETGVSPSHLMTDFFLDTHWSLMGHLGADWQVTLFFLLWIIVLIGLLIGYQTRIMTLLNWLIILSVHERNILVLDGADSVMRVLSFWILFLPVGRAYSLDRYLKPALPETAFAFPLRMVQLQFALIYLATFIFKIHGVMWIDGSAVYHALQLRAFTHPVADWMLATAPYWLFQIATWFTLFAEGAFFLFMFLPFEQPNLKLVGLLAMGLVHIGIGLLMAIPNFSMVMLIGYCLFVEGEWLSRLGKKCFRQHEFKQIPVLSPADKLNWHQWGLVILTGSLLFTVYAYNFWSMRPLGKPLGLPLSTIQLNSVDWLGIWQEWSMFSPNPSTTDGAMLVMGQFADGTRKELRTGLISDNDIPRFYFGVEARWKKYDENLYNNSDIILITAHAGYQCRQHKLTNPDNRLVQVNMIYRSRQTHPINEPENIYHDELLASIDCD